MYDRIGTTYTASRREDPELAGQIHAALGEARTVVNVGAGAGSYEPRDRTVVAVEPSRVMIAQRPAGAAPAVLAAAEQLPFVDASFDAAMAVLTVDHWDEPLAGLDELRRVAARVVVVAADSRIVDRMWLVAEYFPGMAADRAGRWLEPEAIADRLGGRARVVPLPVPFGCRDGFGDAFWGRPEAYLDPSLRPTSRRSGGCRRTRSRPASNGSDVTSPTARGMPVTASFAGCPTWTSGCASSCPTWSSRGCRR